MDRRLRCTPLLCVSLAAFTLSVVSLTACGGDSSADAEFPAGTGASGASGGSGGAVGGSGGTPGGSSGASGAVGGSGGAGGVGGCIDVCGLYGPACCFSSAACIEFGQRCVVDVLSASVATIYEYPELQHELSSIPQDVLVSFTDADIAWAAAEPSPASRIEMHMTPEASSAHGAALEGAGLHPFRVSCDGQELFVGVIYEMIGAAAIKTPVLHVARDAENSVVLSLGAVQGAWLMGGLASPESKERIDRPELRAAFCQRGVLRELDAASD